MATQITPQLLPIELNIEKKKNQVLANIIKMLTNRKLLDVDKLEENIKKITEKISEDMLFKIKLDHPEVYNLETDVFHIKLLKHKITGLTKTTLLGEYLNTNKNPTIIVVDSITQKIHDLIKSTFKNTEIFTEKELMIDLVSHILIPKHELNDEKVTKQLLEEYIVKKKEMPKILLNDPVTKYYNGKPGQSFSIIRPSETSGLAPYHRFIVKGITKH